MTAEGIDIEKISPMLAARGYAGLGPHCFWFKAALAPQSGKIACPRSGNDKPCRLDLAPLDGFLTLKHKSAVAPAQFTGESLHADHAGRLVVFQNCSALMHDYMRSVDCVSSRYLKEGRIGLTPLDVRERIGRFAKPGIGLSTLKDQLEVR